MHRFVEDWLKGQGKWTRRLLYFDLIVATFGALGLLILILIHSVLDASFPGPEEMAPALLLLGLSVGLLGGIYIGAIADGVSKMLASNN